jgi:hypothetical protein
LNIKFTFLGFFFLLVACGVKKAPSPPIKNIISDYKTDWLDLTPTPTPTPTQTPTPTPLPETTKPKKQRSP